MDFSTTVGAREDELDLLACCLTGYDPADVDILPADFDEPKHAAVWQAMSSIANSGGTISPDSVRMALGPNGDNAAVWLLDLIARPVVPANAPAFAERIRTAAHLRNILDAARGLMSEASKPGADPSAITARYAPMLEAPESATKTTTTYADLLPEVIDELDKGLAAGLSTPWPDLDEHIYGLAPGRLYVVAARPGVGKSLMGQNLAWHWSAKHGLPTYFASLEMNGKELTRRELSAQGKVNMGALASGNLDQTDWTMIQQAMPMLESARVHFCTESTQDLNSIRQGARQLQRRKGLGLIVVDYLQIVTPPDARATREQQVAAVSRGLKILAKDLNVPVVAMAQLRRLQEGEKSKLPTLNDLRESGAIEQDADAVMILHIPDESQRYAGVLAVAKAREGKRGSMPLAMRTKWATISPGHVGQIA